MKRVSRILVTALALAVPATAFAWPFTWTGQPPEPYVGSHGWNYTIRVQGSLWTVDVDGDGTPDGWFTVGDGNTAAAAWAPADGMGPLRTYAAFDIHAAGGDPLTAEDPDVPHAEPEWNAQFGAAGASWALELAAGAGKPALAALYAEATGAFGGAALTSDDSTVDWALARWPYVAGAGMGAEVLPLSGAEPATSLQLAITGMGTRLELSGTLVDADGTWNVDLDTGAPGYEQEFPLATPAAYFKGTFFADGATLNIDDPTGGPGQWTLQQWNGKALLHPGPVRHVCASGCAYDTSYGAINSVANGTLVVLAPGSYGPHPSGSAGSGAGNQITNRSHVTLVGSGAGCDEVVLDGYAKDSTLRFNNGGRHIVMNLTAERGWRRSIIASRVEGAEFSDVCTRGYGKMAGSKETHGTSYFGPYGLSAFEANDVHLIRVLSENNATGAVDVVRSTGVVVTDTTMRSTGFNPDWGCLYLSTLSPSVGTGGNSAVTLRGTNTIDDCFMAIHLEDESTADGTPQEAALRFEGELNISNAAAIFRRRGLGLVSPPPAELARQFDACWSLRDIQFDASGPNGQLFMRTKAEVDFFADFLSNGFVGDGFTVAGGRPFTGPHFDPECGGLGYVPNYTLEFAGSVWVVDSDGDGESDGHFMLGDRAGAAWDPTLSQRAFDLPAVGGDPKPDYYPDVIEGDAGWGSDIAQDGSAYGFEMAMGDGKVALAAIYAGLGSASALPLDTAAPSTSEWAIAQWPYVQHPTREMVPLAGAVGAEQAVTSDLGGLERLDLVATLDEAQGGLWSVDYAVGIAGGEEEFQLTQSSFYLRGTWVESGDVVSLPNPVDPQGAPWTLRRLQGSAVVHLGPYVEVCHPSVEGASPAVWPYLSCDYQNVGTATAAAANGTLVAVSPGTFAHDNGNFVARISNKDRITLLGAGLGCDETTIAAPSNQGYGVQVSNSSRTTVRRLTARDAALHHVGVSFGSHIELSQVCGYGQGPTADNNKSYPGPTGLNFNYVQGGVMADVISADNASNGIAVFASERVELRNFTVQNSGGSPGWAGLALYTAPGPSTTTGGDVEIRFAGENVIDGVPMGIYVADSFDPGTGEVFRVDLSHVGQTSITNASTAAIFRLGFGEASDLNGPAGDMGLCWRLDELKAAPDAQIPPVSQAWYATRPEALAAQQGAVAFGLGDPVIAQNADADCDCTGTELCEDGNPCRARECGEEGDCNYPPRLLGDLSGPETVSVGDVLCVILVSLNYNPTFTPACLKTSLVDCDVNCDGTIDVADIQIVIGEAVGLPLPQPIDTNGSGCPDACENYFTP